MNKLATLFLACVIISIACIWIGIFGSLGSIDVCSLSTADGNLSYLAKVPLANCSTQYGGEGLESCIIKRS